MTERTEQLISMFLQASFAMTEEQRDELSSWITQGTANTREFIQASLFHRCIHDILLDSDIERNRILQDDTDMNRGSFDSRLWQMLLKEEETAPGIEIERPVPEEEPIRYVKPEKRQYKFNKTSFLSAITAIAAVLLMIIYVQLFPNTAEVEVATLTNTVNAQWAESAAPTGPNARLMTNHKPLMLRKGYVELVFDNNAKVVLEAPVEFQVLSYDQIKLSYGRLYATVPKEALGFIVLTPTSKIIDLGTEFGVETGFDGTTELHVVKGKTSLVSGFADNKLSILLNGGSAKKITANASSPIDIRCDKQLFARRIDPKSQFVWRGQNVSLADIVGGGNGFGSGQIDRGIDPLTGGVTETLSRTDVYSGPENYVHVPTIPYIDGVFVPGMDASPMQITSTGTQTDEFPKTSGEIWGYIFDGAWHESDDTSRHHLQLNGIQLGDKENPAITMHSNLGITFDLSAIRQTLPGVSIKSFSSVFGVSQTVEEGIKSRDFSNVADMPGVDNLVAERYATAEFWVFLDGKKVLQQKLSSVSEAGTVNIPIEDGVRFLTLAVTEADDTFMFDWSVFSRPELILESNR
ncbi:MAG: NPCBM/NEW2 domain-containing protein [Planctomycetes bacterium]|nr:NPCBM/NEW2 domain-containing protein [Planctomycetota bacterium]